MRRKEPLVVKAITPDEVLALDGGEKDDLNNFTVSLNETLKEHFDGFTLVVDYPIGYRLAIIYKVVQNFREAGWGCTLDSTERKITFWKSKFKRVAMNEEEANKEEVATVSGAHRFCNLTETGS